MEKMSKYRIAKNLGWSWGQLYAVLTKKKHITVEDAVKIHIASNGQISAQSLRPDLKEWVDKARLALAE